MFRVEVRYRYPLERRMEVGSHPTHHVPRQSPQVETLAELGRDYQLPKPRIAAILPFAKPGSNVDTVDSAPSRISPVREKNSHGRCIGHARTNGLQPDCSNSSPERHSAESGAVSPVPLAVAVQPELRAYFITVRKAMDMAGDDRRSRGIGGFADSSVPQAPPGRRPP